MGVNARIGLSFEVFLETRRKVRGDCSERGAGCDRRPENMVFRNLIAADTLCNSPDPPMDVETTGPGEAET